MAKTALEIKKDRLLGRRYVLYSDIKWECTHDNKIINRLKISTKDGKSLYPNHFYLSDHDYLTVPMMCEQCFKKKRLLLALGGRKLERIDK